MQAAAAYEYPEELPAWQSGSLFNQRVQRQSELTQQTMNPIANRIAALNAQIDRARQLVAERQRSARSLQARDDETSKSYVLIHDLTHWLHSLEARRENLLRQSQLMAKRES